MAQRPPPRSPASPYNVPADEARRGAEASSELPASWRLECLGSAAPHEIRPERRIEQAGPGLQRLLRVGRAVQPPDFWERVLPEEAARNTVSREHFEVLYSGGSAPSAGGGKGPGFQLKNLSGRGTFLNDALVQHDAVLSLGDVVAVGEVASEYGSRPALSFRFAGTGTRSSPQDAPTGAPASILGLAPPLPALRPDAAPAARQAAPASDAKLQLQCVAVSGRAVAEVLASQTLLPLCTLPGLLRVGRAAQPGAFWEAVVPNGSLRNAVSRDHFEVHAQAAAAGAAVSLVNRSAVGTLVNGILIRESCPLKPGDLVAIPRPWEVGEGEPIVQFRLCSAATQSTIPLAAPGQASPSATPPRPCRQPSPAASPRSPESPLPVVKVSCAALPAPFTLRCLGGRGLAERELAQLPRCVRVLEASCLNAQLRVGRAVQPPAFWAALMPDEAARNAVWLDHFEVSISEAGELLLTNLSPTGTLVNRKRVVDWVSLLSGDVISLTASLQDDVPVISFGLALAGELEEPLSPEYSEPEAYFQAQV